MRFELQFRFYCMIASFSVALKICSGEQFAHLSKLLTWANYSPEQIAHGICFFKRVFPEHVARSPHIIRCRVWWKSWIPPPTQRNKSANQLHNMCGDAISRGSTLEEQQGTEAASKASGVGWNPKFFLDDFNGKNNESEFNVKGNYALDLVSYSTTSIWYSLSLLHYTLVYRVVLLSTRLYAG